MPKKQTGTLENSLAGQNIRASFYHQPRDLCQQTDLPTNLEQSCKPAAVGMFEYSGSVNICFYRMGPYNTEDNFKQLLANYKHACTANYSIRVQEKYPCRGEENLWSTFKTGVIMTFSKEKINKLSWDITSKCVEMTWQNIGISSSCHEHCYAKLLIILALHKHFVSSFFGVKAAYANSDVFTNPQLSPLGLSYIC